MVFQAHSTLLAFPGVLNQPGDLAFRTDGQDQRHLLLNLQTLNSTAVTAAAAALHNNNNNIATSAVGGIKQPPSLEPSIQPWRGSPPIKVPQYPISQVKPLQQVELLYFQTLLITYIRSVSSEPMSGDKTLFCICVVPISDLGF